MMRERTVDELLWHMGPASRDPDASEWERGFARSMLGASRRRGWQPSGKQLGVMRRIVSERMAGHDAGFEVIEAA